MHPQVLARRFGDERLDRLRIPLGNVVQRLVLGLPVFRVDDVGRRDLEVEPRPDPTGVADDHRHLVLHGQ